MQLSSDRMRDELSSLNSSANSLEGTVGDRGERIAGEMDSLTQDLHVQLERRREHFRKMVTDVAAIGDSLRSLVDDLKDQRKGADEAQSKIQGHLQVVDHTMRQDFGGLGGGRGSLAPTVDVVPAQPMHAGMAGGYGAAYPGARAGLAGMAGSGSPTAVSYGQVPGAYGQARPMMSTQGSVVYR
mmetsp:Transcript_61910/g.200605  ORF Transcript_61910/g.200605 Transcript_61910/m.200605 type:complete len:184 (+) Transcript_61910:193-744(+)